VTGPEERPRAEGPIVEVLYLNTNEDVQFHAAWEDTLAQVWEEAYERLQEKRRDGDEFQCQDGTSLLQYITLTLAQLREKHICQDRKFAIRSETGGAQTYGPHH
jgi:hypothetical protein